MTNKLRVIIPILLYLLMSILMVLWLIGLIRPLSLKARSLGNPVIVTRDSDLLFTGISQIVSDESRIYILFGSYSIVQVYTHAGEYLYTISVYDYMNGRTKIATFNNHLYILDKIGNAYVFCDDCFVEFIDRKELKTYSTLPNFGLNDPEYCVHLGSIWKTSAEGRTEVIIQRPIILSIYQDDLIWKIMFISMVTIGLVVTFPSPQKRT